MRLHDIYPLSEDENQLDEMPLGGFHLRHDKDKDFDPKRPNGKGWSNEDLRRYKGEENVGPSDNVESFFRKSDRIAITNKKTIEKLERVLEKFRVDFQFVFVNTTVQDKTWSNFRGEIKPKMIRKAAINPKINAGAYDKELGSTNEHLLAVKHLHEQNPESCTVVYRSNDPDGYEGHMPLTPWIMLHRLAHSFPTIMQEMTSLIEKLSRQFWKFEANDEYDKRSIHQEHIPRNWLKRMFPFRTARLGLWESYAELSIDMLVHMMINPNYRLPIYENVFPMAVKLEDMTNNIAPYRLARDVYEEVREEYKLMRNKLITLMDVGLRGKVYIV